MPFNMTSLNLDKKKFVADCITEYRNTDEYDITLVFDEYFDKVVDKPDVSGSLTATDLLSLYDELYLMVESVLVDEYESAAETDDEKS
jgi:hypothetical protein